MKATEWLHDKGPSIWLDNIARTLLDSCTHGARPQRLRYRNQRSRSLRHSFIKCAGCALYRDPDVRGDVEGLGDSC